ncbi:MAG: hypothetical protein FKGGLIKP_00378 [Sodalis sp. Fse]|nr:MAG: hypothetical protein FKGGLIKP_00378 [Sodalis sp. Fse]
MYSCKLMGKEIFHWYMYIQNMLLSLGLSKKWYTEFDF